MSAFVSHKDIGKAHTPPTIPIIADVSDCKGKKKMLYVQIKKRRIVIPTTQSFT